MPPPERAPPRPWLKWYSRRSWKQRRKAQLTREPFCRMCLERGVYTVATVADHVTPHRGDPVLFEGPLQSLCSTHHNRDKKLEEREGPAVRCDADGWPIRG